MAVPASASDHTGISFMIFFPLVLTHQEKQPREHRAGRIEGSLGWHSWCHYLTFSNALFLICTSSAGKKIKGGGVGRKL